MKGKVGNAMKPKAMLCKRHHAALLMKKGHQNGYAACQKKDGAPGLALCRAAEGESVLLAVTMMDAEGLT